MKQSDEQRFVPVPSATRTPNWVLRPNAKTGEALSGGCEKLKNKDGKEADERGFEMKIKCERCGYEADYYDHDHWVYRGRTLCLDCINELEKGEG